MNEPQIVEVNRTYKYRLYANREVNRRLHDAINIAGIIWNHITALRRRYYRLFGKHLHVNQLKAHVAKLRKKRAPFKHWQLVGSQAVPDICERHDKGYDRFFKKEGGLKIACSTARAVVCRWIGITTRHGMFLRWGIISYCLSRWKTNNLNRLRHPTFTAEAAAEKRGSMSQ
jgi:hypothetical protein